MLPYTVSFRIDHPHGHCVGVHLPALDPAPPPAARELLHADELAHGATLAPRRQISWFGGRIALRTALGDIGASVDAIAINDRGAPDLPRDVVGTISHKDGVAVALVAPRRGWEVGIDVESVLPGAHDIARHVLTDEERRSLDSFGDEERRREVLLRFSAKEALYKALDPYVRRFVGFKEVEAWPQGDEIAFQLSLGASEGPFETEGRWAARDEFFLTTARVRARP